METNCKGVRCGHRTGTQTHDITQTQRYVQYLSGHTLTGAVLQKEPDHLEVILLGSHVQRSEAILHTANTQLQTCQDKLIFAAFPVITSYNILHGMTNVF